MTRQVSDLAWGSERLSRRAVLSVSVLVALVNGAAALAFWHGVVLFTWPFAVSAAVLTALGCVLLGLYLSRKARSTEGAVIMLSATSVGSALAQVVALFLVAAIGS